MARVTVTIAGRTFHIACGDGEEAHLEGLARQVDEKIGELRTAFGEIGDQRLIVMAAISVADELAEAKRKLAVMEAEIAALRAAQQQASGVNDSVTEALVSALEQAAVRIESSAKAMR